LVKNIFKEYQKSIHCNNKKFDLVNKKVIKPEYKEQQQNPSSRSAKLRIIERLA
jgi:16S rRNA C1402 N4-methylase RsmH